MYVLFWFLFKPKDMMMCGTKPFLTRPFLIVSTFVVIYLYAAANSQEAHTARHTYNDTFVGSLKCYATLDTMHTLTRHELVNCLPDNLFVCTHSHTNCWQCHSGPCQNFMQNISYQDILSAMHLAFSDQSIYI